MGMAMFFVYVSENGTSYGAVKKIKVKDGRFYF